MTKDNPTSSKPPLVASQPDRPPTDETLSPEEKQEHGTSEKTSEKTSEEKLESGEFASKPSLEAADGLTTSRLGRLVKTGWAARHAVPLAFKRAYDLLSADKSERGEVAEQILKEQENIAEELFRTLGNLKGVVQKFGQLASYLEGILPKELAPIYQRVLARLQDSAPAMPPLASQALIEEELDCLIEDVFPEFEEQPFAAASVGQVHRARLRDGTKVAVKVQYPDIDRAFVSDLKNMKMMEMLFAPVIHYYRGREILDTIRQQLLDELDYEREAAMQNKFAASFAGDPWIQIPHVFTEYSTRRVLVTELKEGLSFAQLEQAENSVRTRAAETMSRYYLDSIWVHHLVNVDPHPGNYVFHDNGCVSFLDFGAAVSLDPRRTGHLRQHLLAYIEGDTASFRNSLNQVYGIPTEDPVLLDAYEAMIRHFLQPLAPERQPFLFSTGWMESCFEEGMARSKDILLRGGRIPKLPPPPTHVNPDMPVIYRVAIGLGSLLARLRVSLDWSELFFASLKKSPSQK